MGSIFRQWALSSDYELYLQTMDSIFGLWTLSSDNGLYLESIGSILRQWALSSDNGLYLQTIGSIFTQLVLSLRNHFYPHGDLRFHGLPLRLFGFRVDDYVVKLPACVYVAMRMCKHVCMYALYMCLWLFMKRKSFLIETMHSDTERTSKQNNLSIIWKTANRERQRERVCVSESKFVITQQHIPSHTHTHTHTHTYIQRTYCENVGVRPWPPTCSQISQKRDHVSADLCPCKACARHLVLDLYW